MHVTHKPLSAIALAPTKANFPALEHFFPCDETSGTTLTDSVGGVVISPSTFTPHVGGNGSIDVANVAAVLDEGTWESPESKNMVIFFVGACLNLVDFSMGATAGEQGISFAGVQAANNQVEVRDDDTTVEAAGTAFTASANDSGLRGITINFAGDMTMFEKAPDDGVWTSALSTTTLTGITGMTAVDQTYEIVNPALFGLAIFHFDTLPTDLQAAMEWMFHEWTVNLNKVIYPGWKDRA